MHHILPRVVLVLIVAAAISIGGCSRKDPADGPVPWGNSGLKPEAVRKIGKGLTLEEAEKILGKGKSITADEVKRITGGGANPPSGEHYQWGTPPNPLILQFMDGKVVGFINLTSLQTRDD